jgi:hypothetical protein
MNQCAIRLMTRILTDKGNPTTSAWFSQRRQPTAPAFWPSKTTPKVAKRPALAGK